ncbi:amidohydrolase family protein [Duganella sp. FT80W]|uniref:Amidohydrolase family protein n=1 Tax=Duganella guangzhouensis TaxID=2666084 RepID=A0A6I2LC68_9BURK|nr:amidohydrolase family protein [Duganella guangzhouensis]MRW93849.1 amidohydrolase family protein [Duganella guangzhouensis]
MMRPSRSLAAVLLALCASASQAAVDSYSVMENGAKVGSLTADRKGKAVDIAYAVSSNGRGPKLKEQLVLGAGGMPSSWQINGNSLMGGDVQESMAYQDGTLRWTSQADSGERKLAAPGLYIGNDTSPWALGMYAQALLKAPGLKLDVLPAGTLSLAKLRAVPLKHNGRALKLTAYVISGVTLVPKFLLLDDQQQLFAVLDDSLLVRGGFENHYQELKALGDALAGEYLASLQQRLAHRFDGTVRIRNVHVFDPASGQRGPLSSVTYYRGVISTVAPEGSEMEAADKEIDGKGGTLVPGLHDMHAHNTAWSGLFYIAAGVTATRDMGNENPRLLELSRRTEAGELAGPDMIRAGFLEGRSDYSAALGFLPATLEEGKRDVRWYADHGYRWIKVYNSMNPAWVAPLAAEAHRLGLGVLGHVPAFATPDQMLEAGYDEVTHINQLMLGWLLKPGEDTRTPLRLTALSRAADLQLDSAPVKHTVALMKQRNAGLDTTLSIVEQLMMSRTGEVAEGAAAYLEHLPIGYQRYRKRSYIKFKDDAEKQRYADAFAKVLETTGMLHREGIALWPGTDDPSGFLLHREIELYVKAGLTPAEALKIATLECERHFGRDQQYGSIERGKRADFLLVPGDPLQDLSLLHRIGMVVKGGVVYYPDQIYSAINIVPFGGDK